MEAILRYVLFSIFRSRSAKVVADIDTILVAKKEGERERESEREREWTTEGRSYELEDA